MEEALVKRFSTVQFVLDENTKYLRSYHGKTKILKICSFFKKKLIPLSSCYYLVIGEINCLAHDNTRVTTVR